MHSKQRFSFKEYILNLVSGVSNSGVFIVESSQLRQTLTHGEPKRQFLSVAFYRLIMLENDWLQKICYIGGVL